MTFEEMCQQAIDNGNQGAAEECRVCHGTGKLQTHQQLAGFKVCDCVFKNRGEPTNSDRLKAAFDSCFRW